MFEVEVKIEVSFTHNMFAEKNHLLTPEFGFFQSDPPPPFEILDPPLICSGQFDTSSPPQSVLFAAILPLDIISSEKCECSRILPSHYSERLIIMDIIPIL